MIIIKLNVQQYALKYPRLIHSTQIIQYILSQQYNLEAGKDLGSHGIQGLLYENEETDLEMLWTWPWS